MSPHIAPLRSEDAQAAAEVLGRAFVDNPVNVAVIGADPERRERCNRAGVEAYLPAALEAGWVAGAWQGPPLAAGGERELCGVLVAMPPGAFPLPVPGFLAAMRLLWQQGPRVASRFGDVARTLSALHPAEPHWTLATLGVDPLAQGRGVGSALLAAFTSVVANDGLAAYLDTDREENLAFYRPSGYEVIGTTRILGVEVHQMLRRPDPANSSR